MKGGLSGSSIQETREFFGALRRRKDGVFHIFFGFILFLHRVDMFLLCASFRWEIGFEYFVLVVSLGRGRTVLILELMGRK